MPARASRLAPFLSLVFLSLLALARPAAADDPAALVHLLGYIGVDYPATVVNGQVRDQDEYAEQREFAARAGQQLKVLPPTPEQPGLLKQADELARLIARKAPGDQVARLTEQMRDTLVSSYRITVAPRRAPDLKLGAKLYAEHCAGCHGADGRGDGPAARGLDPAPVDFHDGARQQQRSVYALFNAVTLGVAGTAMQGYGAQLDDDARWALALYAANFLASDAERRDGAALWAQHPGRARLESLAAVTGLSPKQARAELGEDGWRMLAWLRSEPQAVVSKEAPLAYSARVLGESLARYRAGKPDEAYALAVNAYLEGFELAETGLMAVKPELKQEVEREMYAYRNLIQARAPLAEVAAAAERLVARLGEARALLEGTSLSPTVAFASSLVILLREGLEAILLLAVVVAFLIKTGRRAALKYIHIGWVTALLLGVATWAVASYVVDVSGASRELTEGVTALFAAAVLLYVGFWLHDKLHAQRWKEFIETKVHGAFEGGTLWGIALVAFIAVYREVFETVLFYQTLWLQAGRGGQHLVLWGFASAAVLLVALSWAIFRFSVRLPLRLFFAVNSVLLYLLAVVFAGKGVAALQEAGTLPVSAVNFPTIDVLGIYPNLQVLGLQGALLLAAALFVFWNRRKAAG
jgi:high-affinity iron transporter